MGKTDSALLSSGAVLTAALIGGQNGPQRPATAAWYALLRKPGYTPPGPLVGGLWGLLEVLLGVAGYRLLRAPSSPARTTAVSAWSFTLAGLAGYPWLFFRKKRLKASMVGSGAMLASATCMVFAASKADRPAAVMSVPLLLWLGFATMLSEELWQRNPYLSRD